MKKTVTEHNLFTARRQAGLTPGRVLDTMVVVNEEATDVQLTPEAATRIAQTVEAVLPVWDTLYQSPNLTPEEMAVVKRHLGEISLVAAAAEQVLFDVDNSDDIKLLEEELYDYYSPDLFHQAVRAKAAQITSLALPRQYESVRQGVLDELSGYEATAGTSEDSGPAEQTLQAVERWLGDQFGDVMDEIDQDSRDEYDAASMVDYFQKSIDSTPALRTTGWKAALVERQKNAVSTNFFEKEVVVPTQRKASRQVLKKLTVHEVFGHALRSAQAEAYGMEIGQHGTASYARFEESFMIALEQCLEGKHDPKRGVDHYVTAGLSITGGSSKESIAKLTSDMSFLEWVAKGKDETVAKEKSYARAKVLIGRAFTGMTDVDDGIAHRKDIDYYHGLNDAWNLLNFAVAHDILDEAMHWVLSAKFNPFNEADRAYVNQYVPMPAALNGLFDQAA